MPTSKAQQRAVAKYDNAHYDKCLLRFKKGELEAARAHAKSLGLSFNAFALLAINKAMSNDSSIDTSNDSSIDTSNDSSIDTSNDSSIDTSNDSSIDTSNDSSIDASNDSSIDTSNDSSIDTSNDSSIDTSNDSSIDTSNDSSIDASNDSSIDASNDSSISRCIFCGIVIEGKKNKKYCSAKCRMANHRKSKDTTES